MSTPPLTSDSPDAPAEEDNPAADLPLTMAASVILDHLPKDAHQALETAGELEQAKGTPTISSTPSGVL
jgi:ubiquitin-like protein ATG12